MSDKQQSAVDWLFEQLTEVDYNCINKTFLQNNNSMAGYKLRELFDQAKELFKQQSEFMFECGRNFQMTADGTFNEVYNETFKTESNGTT